MNGEEIDYSKLMEESEGCPWYEVSCEGRECCDCDLREDDHEE